MIPIQGEARNKTTLPYMRQLDGLRAFAVLGVLWTHYVPQELWLLGMNLGEFGVRLFFVLSGFLITSLLMDARGRILREEQTLFAALRQFYLRRFLRIFPLFYATLGVAFVLAIPPVRETLAWHTLYLSNIYMAESGTWPRAVAHLWSLAIEEQFYLAWPWVVFVMPLRFLPPAILSLLVIGPMFRSIGVLAGWNDVANRVLTPAAIDTLGYGCLLAYISHGKTTDASAVRRHARIMPCCWVTAHAFRRLRRLFCL